MGTQFAAPSWQTQAVQASGSQRAPSGQARPKPQHWGEARWHSQDSSCVTLPCSSLFWGRGGRRHWFSLPHCLPQGMKARAGGEGRAEMGPPPGSIPLRQRQFSWPGVWMGSWRSMGPQPSSLDKRVPSPHYPTVKDLYPSKIFPDGVLYEVGTP